MKDTLLTFELYGELGEKFGKRFELQCSSVREGMGILSANFKNFRKHMIDSSGWLQGYEVWAGDTPLSSSETDLAKHRSGVIKVIPVVKGASANARIIIGAILVIYGVWYGNKDAVMMGAALVAGGIAEKLSPKVRVDPQQDLGDIDKATSYIFSGPANNIRQGVPVAIGYGRMFIGSSVISSAVSTVDTPV